METKKKKTFLISATGFLYEYEYKAISKEKAINQFKKDFKELTGEEEILIRLKK